MHEMGIASSVLDAVRTEAARLPGSKPARVGLRIGEWTGVDTESLRFCFEALVAGSDLAGLSLEIESRERCNRCEPCGLEFRVMDYDIRCPKCGTETTAAISGTELDLAFVELEEEEKLWNASP